MMAAEAIAVLDAAVSGWCDITPLEFRWRVNERDAATRSDLRAAWDVAQAVAIALPSELEPLSLVSRATVARKR